LEGGYLEFYLTNLNNDDCSYIDYYILSEGAPCVDGTFGLGSASRSFCNLYDYYYASSTTSEEYNNGEESSYFKYQPGKYVYIGIGTDSTYVGSVCTYSFQINASTPCPSGQVGTYNGDSTSQCISYISVADASNYTYSLNNVSSVGLVQEWQLPIPQATGSISFTVSSTEDFDLSGTVNFGNVDYTNIDGSASGSMNSNTQLYSATLTCYVPESGNLFVYFESDSSPSSSTLSLNASSSIQVCSGTMIGTACQYPATQINISNPQAMNFAIPYNSSNYNFQYLWFDVPANYPSANIQVNVYLTNITNDENIYFVVQKDAIPAYPYYSPRTGTQYQYMSSAESEYWVFSWQDFAVQNRVYLGFVCYDNTVSGSDVCNVSITWNSTSTTSTTGTSGNTATTTGTTTGNTGVATSTGTTTTGTTGNTTSTGTTSTGSTTMTTRAMTTQPVTSSNVVTTSSASTIAMGLLVLIAAALF
jgi:hypothetical protein